MLEMEAGPQKIARGALIRRDIWERLQVHWLHAGEILQNQCQLECIPVLWGPWAPMCRLEEPRLRQDFLSASSVLVTQSPSPIPHSDWAPKDGSCTSPSEPQVRAVPEHCPIGLR